MDLDFLLDRYKWELERREKLTAAVAFPTTILVFLGGLLAAMARGFTYERDWQTACLSAGLLVALVVASNCLYCLTRAYHGSTYHYLPRLNELENAFVDAIDQNPSDGEQEFDGIFRERIIDATDDNARASDTWQAYLDRANFRLILFVIATAFCGVLYVLDQIAQR